MHGRITSHTIMGIVGVVLVIGVLGWALVRVLNAPLVSGNSATTTSSSSGADQSTPSPVLSRTYTNHEYGFSISYPADLETTSFASFHALPNSWRVNTPPGIRGTPIVAIPILRTDESTSTPKTYPLFFDAEVRIGVSTDTKDCYMPDSGYTLQTVADVSINGVTWKKFIFGDAAMMQYLSGASYRTIHDNRCFALEQVRTGSTYWDETMTRRYTDEELDSTYAETIPIIQSFRFTR